MNFYAFHIGDYAGATRHLSWDEDMAYRRMLDVYYTREAPLPADRKQLYRLVGATEKRQREAVDAVLYRMFTETARGFASAEIEECISADKKRQKKSRGWEQRLDVSFGQWRRLRALILEAYAWTCAYCRNPASSVDHLVPICQGGESTVDNLLPACKVCNSSKGDREYRSWRYGGGLQ